MMPPVIRRWLQRFLDKHAPVLDWPELGSDDEPIDFVPCDDDPHNDPNACGCGDCVDLVERIRGKLDRAFQMQRDLEVCQAIARASGMADA